MAIHRHYPVFAGERRVQVGMRPFLNSELTSDDGLIDFVAVDQALRGRRVELNKYEMDEVCRALNELSIKYDGKVHDERSPFCILKKLLVEAYGQEFERKYRLYREKSTLRRRRDAAMAG
jgi:hypothetical protein